MNGRLNRRNKAAISYSSSVMSTGPKMIARPMGLFFLVCLNWETTNGLKKKEFGMIFRSFKWGIKQYFLNLLLFLLFKRFAWQKFISFRDFGEHCIGSQTSRS